ncbi:PBECR2 nuclease fold domain-containing protein [Caulobacter sp. SL161]|uniref:PBECR2 nuclease fold domain-containing protein n=1 Tax=Caulobacter sp. SL161 TaxID=2995156 RepID=UPI002275CC2F|nr:PBECR2 nuclease fold domain-containing protein [Caulobacter sp. SL161]MCY1648173.1 PBECR2 nuclease fold domain-containing protein [Caulobacter sp. SL161]
MTGVINFKGRPPAQAVDYLESKVVGGRFSFDWKDVQREEHLVSFVVAKAMTRDVLVDIHSGLVEAIKAGKSRQQFIQELTPLLQAKGWWGRQLADDPTTGETRRVQLGSPRRVGTIFGMNMRMAHAAGRWERFMDTASTRPYLTYHHTPNENPRLEHIALSGVTLPIGHVFWKTHFCPNGFGCQCFITSERVGVAVTSEEELQRVGAYDTRTWTNKRTGETREIPVGVDPGFDYNVGEARLASFVPPPSPERQRPYVQGERTPRALPNVRQARSLPSGVKLRPDLGGADAPAVFEAFSKVLGKGEGEVFIDAAQVPVVVGQRMFERHTATGASVAAKEHLAGRAAYAEILAATLKDPDEIWHSIQSRADGSSVFVRNYVSWINTGSDGREAFVVSFHDRDGVWWGATAYPPGNRGKARDQRTQTDAGFRVGALVYSRK